MKKKSCIFLALICLAALAIDFTVFPQKLDGHASNTLVITVVIALVALFVLEAFTASVVRRYSYSGILAGKKCDKYQEFDRQNYWTSFFTVAIVLCTLPAPAVSVLLSNLLGIGSGVVAALFFPLAVLILNSRRARLTE